MRVALRLGRECIAVADSPKEASFLVNYAHHLHVIDCVNNTFLRMDRIYKGEQVEQADQVDPADPRVDAQPAERPASIVVHTYDRKDVGDGADVLAALGLDGEGPAEPSGVQAEIGGGADGVPSATNVLEEGATDTPAPPLGAEEQASAEVRTDPPANANMEGHVIVSPATAAAPATTAQADPARMDQTQQASAHLPCPPNLSSYSSLSNNIQLLVNSKKKVSSVGALSITTNKPVFSHYEWAFGIKKGKG